MRIDRQWMSSHLPHQGDMLLLDAVERWDEDSIACVANSHRSPQMPLRSHGRLGVACGVEYAAQAMAIHDVLVRTGHGQQPLGTGIGYIASVRGLVASVTRLDDIDGNLTIRTTRLAGQRNLLYGFTISAGPRSMLEGRVAIFVDIDSPEHALPSRSESNV